MLVQFVRQGSKPDELMEEAYKEAKESDGDCLWITEEDCLKVDQRDRKAVFIFTKFSGQAFEQIHRTGNRIYGPSVITTSMKNGYQLPKMDHPVHNLSMKGLIVSCTSVNKTSRAELHQFIQWMCGEVSKDLHDKITHLIAGEAGSKKYLVAANLKKKIMSPGWVTAVWNKNQKEFVHADNEHFGSHRCPVFQGFVMTASGLEGSERAEVKEIIEKEGGRFSGEMKIDECTHLIINHPRGTKYEFARKWKIPILSPAWLFDCVEAGYYIEDHKYRVDMNAGETGSSHDANSSRFSIAGDISRINETAMNQTAMNQTAMNQSAMNQSAMNQTIVRPAEPDLLDRVNLTKVKPGMFLDGCKIFLSGFGGSRIEKLRKMINLGGGTRFSQINESVTHVVMGDRVEAHITLLKEAKFRPHVVSVDWIIASVQNGRQVAEEDFVSLDLPQMEPTSPHPKARPQTSSQTAMPPPAPVAPPVERNQTEAAEDMQDLLSQYLPGASDLTNDSALIRAAEAAEEVERKEEQIPIENEDDDATQDPSEEPEQEIFVGKKFAFVGFAAEMETRLRELVAEFEGEVVPVTTRAVPDFAVVPLFGCQVNFTAAEIVTAAYVQMCVESEELLEVSSNPIFTPLDVRPGATPLTECFITMSGYTGTERDCLMQLAEQLGATCQDTFRRKAKDGIPASTHLVVKEAEGSKYQAAKKWKIPALEKEWLFSCLRSGVYEPEENFLVDRPRTRASTDIQSEPPTRSASTGPQNMDTKPSTSFTSTRPQNMDSESSRVLKTVDLNNLDKGQVKVDCNTKTAVSLPTDTTDEALLNSVVTTGDTKKRQGSIKKKCEDDVEEADTGLDSPSKFLNPNIAYKPRFDLTGFMAALDSPSQPWNRRKNSEDEIDLEALVTQQLAIAIENTSSPSKMVSTPERPNARKPPHWPPYWVRKHVLKQQITGPLQGVVVYVSAKLHHRQGECLDIAVSLGGDYTMKYDDSCTHVIFQGSLNDADKEFRLARDEKKLIVSPFWLTMCKEQKAHVEESLFPHTYDPDRALQPKGPLQGVVINVCKKLSSKQSDYNDMAVSLGAEYCWTYDKSCTHFIFQGKQNDLNKEFRSARNDGKIIVSPYWLTKCKETNCWVEESLYPHTYDPNAVPEPESQPPSGPLQGVVINVCKKLSSKQSEYNDMATSLGAEYCWTYDKSCTHFIFQGRKNDMNKEFRLAREEKKIIVSPHWLTMCKEQNALVDESLFPHTYDPKLALSVVKTSCTPDRLTRRSTRSQLKSTSSVAWTSPPHPSRQTSVQIKSSPVSTTPTPAAEQPAELTETRPNPDLEMSESDEGDSGTCDESGSEQVPLTQPGQTLAREALVDDIKNLMAATKTSRGKRKTRRTDSVSGEFSEEPEIKRSSTGSRNKSDDADLSHGSRSTRSSLRTRSLKKPEIGMEPSQMVEVTWDDPRAREQQEMLAAELAKNSESFSPKHHGHYTSEEEGNNTSTDDEHKQQKSEFPQSDKETEDEPMPPPPAPSVAVDQPVAVNMMSDTEADVDPDETVNERPQPVFLLSGLTPQERDDYSAFIEELGGQSSNSGHYESECTHLITGKPSRNEKYLGSVAAGKWVLHKSYLDACRQQNTFVEESDHEWGSEAMASILDGQPVHIQKLAAAAHRWRTALGQGQQSHGAFSEWTAILFTGHKREGGFQRLLEAGGCQIKSQRPPFDLDGVKYAFVEPAHVDFQSEQDHLLNAGVLCLKPEYIASFLMEDPAPNPRQYLIKEVMKQGDSETRKRKPSEEQTTSDNKRLRMN